MKHLSKKFLRAYIRKYYMKNKEKNIHIRMYYKITY